MPKISNPFKKLFGRKSKDNEMDEELKEIEKSRDDLQDAAREAADQAERRGDDAAAADITDIAEKLERDPLAAVDKVGKLAETVEKSDLPSSIKIKLKKKIDVLSGAIKGKLKKLKKAMDVERRREKCEKNFQKAMVDFFEKFVKMASPNNTFYLFFIGSIGKIEVYEDNFFKYLLECIRGSELYTDKSLKAQKLCKIWIKECERALKEMSVCARKLSKVKDKKELLDKLEEKQKYFLNWILNIFSRNNPLNNKEDRFSKAMCQPKCIGNYKKIKNNFWGRSTVCRGEYAKMIGVDLEQEDAGALY